MSFKYWKDGNCKICGQHTYVSCDNCSLYACEDHLTKIAVAHEKRVYVCSNCEGFVRPNIKIGGVHITEKMLMH